MIDELKELISEILDLPKNQISLNSGPASLPQWDSLAHFCIVAAVEDKFKIKLEMNEIINISNLEDIEKIILKKK